jgi:glycosyltransferase involved in cell wall biosynthesis
VAAVYLIIPALNEAKSLPHVFEAIADAGLEAEIVVVDDGSTDDTAETATALGARVIRHPFNMGYGAAIQTGYMYALEHGAELLVQMDADGQHDPRQIPAMVEPIRRDECDLVIASRFLEVTGYRMGWVRTAGRKIFEALGNLAGVKVTDPTSGFQAMNAATLELYVQDFFPHDYPDVDVLVTATRHGLRVRECASLMHPGLRASKLHGGTRAFYYAYKMLVSMWAASSDGKKP